MPTLLQNPVQELVCIDDDEAIPSLVQAYVRSSVALVRPFESAEAFLEWWSPARRAVILLDLWLPGMSGLDLLRAHKPRLGTSTVVVMTGSADIRSAVESMRAGAFDFIGKPLDPNALLEAVRRASNQELSLWGADQERQLVKARLATLSPREIEVLAHLLDSETNRETAEKLDISARTVEVHRRNILTKMAAAGVVEVANNLWRHGLMGEVIGAAGTTTPNHQEVARA